MTILHTVLPQILLDCYLSLITLGKLQNEVAEHAQLL